MIKTTNIRKLKNPVRAVNYSRYRGKGRPRKEDYDWTDEGLFIKVGNQEYSVAVWDD